MSHFGGACIRALGDKRNSERLFAVRARDLYRIFIRVLNILLLDPKQHSTFRTFSNEHGHGAFSKVHWFFGGHLV